MENGRWDVVVIGGGAAGLSAALALGRARRRVLVIDAGQPRNRFATHMQGVLGHEGRDPAELIRLGRKEAAEYNTTFLDATVRRVDDDGAGVLVTLADGAAHRARAVIVATGLTDDLPDIPGLVERWGHTVLHCPYCHGWEVRDGRLGVLGTSPLSVHQVELVRQWSDRVTLFTERIGPLDPTTERRLRAREIELVNEPVTEVIGNGGGDSDGITDQLTGVRTGSGTVVPVDALFVAPTARPHDEFLSHLGLDRTEGPAGSFLTVDTTGKTSHDRIWAAGNVVAPTANVPMAISAGFVAGSSVNLALVHEEFDTALDAATRADDQPSLREHWEQRYGSTDQMWSGRANRTLVDVVSELAVGRALDLGCGEGADAIWLAERGWDVTGIDVSSTAIARARAAAERAGIPPERIRFHAQDLASWAGSDGGVHDTAHDETYDLVTACFFHSPIEIPRADILRRAAMLVAPGGHILIVSHADFPPWADQRDIPGGEHHFLSPDEEIAALDLPPADWQVRIAERRSRPAVGPDGRHATLEDTVVLLRRR